jgi:hypothetical protein
MPDTTDLAEQRGEAPEDVVEGVAAPSDANVRHRVEERCPAASLRHEGWSSGGATEPRHGPAPHARPQSCRVASRAPSAMAANFNHATLGWVSLNRMPEAAKPQSAPAMTFSRPTIRA